MEIFPLFMRKLKQTAKTVRLSLPYMMNKNRRPKSMI